MILIRLRNVSKAFGQLDVLKDVSFEFQTGQRVGLTGRNGTGKTTLFHLITDRMEPDTGEVWVSRDCRVSMMEQIPRFDAGVTAHSVAHGAFDDLHALQDESEGIRTRLGAGEVAHGSQAEDELLGRLGHLDDEFRRRGGFEMDFRIRSVLNGLGFRAEDMDKPVEVMSGGEKNRLALARMLLQQPDILLLDEPTNHLDLAAIEWLENYLRSWERGFIVISHDRFLLDQVTQETLDLDRCRLTRWSAPYSAAHVLRDEQRARQNKAHDLQQKEIARQEVFIQKNIYGQKHRQAQSRRKMLERIERVERVESDSSGTVIRIEPHVNTGRDVLMAEGLRAEIAGRELFRDVSVHVRRGDRIGILGPNGSGKTTLLNIFAGDRRPDGGSVIQGAGVMLAFLDQQHRFENLDQTVLEVVHELRPLAEQGQMRGYLARFLFKGDDVFQPIRVLSGGERNRLAIARLFLEGPNLVFLDEPTNHLDIDGREALERALAEYTGTVIAVSHDRAFLNNFASSIWNLHDGGLDQHLGDFDGFKRDEMARAARAAAAGAENGGEIAGPSVGARDHEERKRLRRQREKDEREAKRRDERLAVVEVEIAGREAEMETVVAGMAGAGVTPEELRSMTERHRELTEARDALYAEWETLAEAASEDPTGGDAR